MAIVYSSKAATSDFLVISDLVSGSQAELAAQTFQFILLKNLQKDKNNKT